MTFSDGVVDANLIVCSISDEGGEWTWDLVEQRPNLRAIINIMGRRLRCEDLPSLGIHPDVLLAPGPASPGPMLLDQPLAGPAELQARAVQQQVHRSSGAGTWLWHLQGCGPPA